MLGGLEFPAAIASTPDGRLLIAEQVTGRVRVVQDGELNDVPWLELDVLYKPDQFFQELGLVGVAVDPRFEDNRFVYVYYTEQQEGSARRTVFARLRDEGGRGTDLTELFAIAPAPEQVHIAGGIAFDGLDAILVSVGDHERPDEAQDLTTLRGSIVRIDRDGNALPDNPFVDRAGADSRIFAYGLRNPFGIAVDPEGFSTYFTENRLTAGDAIYELVAGRNYGWPNELAQHKPLVFYDFPRGMAGAIVYRGEQLPAFNGDVLYCTFHQGGALHWSDPDAAADSFEVFRRDQIVAPGCQTNLTQGADGFLYYLDYAKGRLLRIAR